MATLFRMLSTLVIYLLVIVPSVLLVSGAERSFQKQKKTRFVLLMAFAVLLPCLLSGFRGETVGVDVLVYAEPVYLRAAMAKSLPALIAMKTRYELGYLTLAYVSSHVFRSFNAMLLLTQLLVLLPIYIGAHRLRERVPAWSVVLCYLLLFYPITFNIMREGIGTSFIFLTMINLWDRKYVRSVVSAAFGVLFHSSAMIGIVLILFVLWFRTIKSSQMRWLVLIAVTLAVPIIMSRWTQILTLMVHLGLIKSRYLYYIRSIEGGSYLTKLYGSNYVQLAFKWLFVFVPLLYYRRVRRESGDFQYTLLIGVLLATMIYTSVFFLLHSSYGYRVSFYLETLYVVWLSTLAEERLHFSRFPIKTGVMMITAFSFFFVAYVWLGIHGTLPLVFEIYHF